jgi:hypothetical protein
MSTAVRKKKEKACMSGAAKALAKEPRKVRDLEERQLFDATTALPIKPRDEQEAEECFKWLEELSVREIDAFCDLNEGEKAFMRLWNAFLTKYPCHGDGMMLDTLEHFVHRHNGNIWRQRLYRNFILHLTVMVEHKVIDHWLMVGITRRLQATFGNFRRAAAAISA